MLLNLVRLGHISLYLNLREGFEEMLQDLGRWFAQFGHVGTFLLVSKFEGGL